MDKKKIIRRKYFLKRRKNYFEINESFFYPLIKLLKKKYKNKKKNIAIYYPSSYEVNTLKILNIDYFRKFNFLLPIIQKNKSMDFYLWKKLDILYINDYGIPEPIKSSKVTPSIVLVPLLAFDKKKNRVGYGKGFYDKYFNKYLNFQKKILTVGVAFSFQKHNKIPTKKYDFQLDYIITEKGII